MRSGVVAVVGRPNVGKSSLINALIGRKISIVAPKPQTTRQRIQCVLHGQDAQVVLVDTPGLHHQASRALNRYMNRSAIEALADVDLVLFVIEASRWQSEDEAVLTRLHEASCPTALVINKVDRLSRKTELLPQIDALSRRSQFLFVMPVSAKSGDNCSALADALFASIPEGPPLYPPEQLCDHDTGFLIAETVREKLIRALGQELPYSATVTLDSMTRQGTLLRVAAVIWVEREGQKKIVIGDDGMMLKRIGSAARRELEALHGGRIYLHLWVKVKANWTDDPMALRRFGYEEA